MKKGNRFDEYLPTLIFKQCLSYKENFKLKNKCRFCKLPGNKNFKKMKKEIIDKIVKIR